MAILRQLAGRPFWPLRGYTASVAPRVNQEIEIKLRVTDPSALRWLLVTLSARRLSRVQENNVLYDTPGYTLRRRGQLLRLRIERRLGLGARRNQHTGKVQRSRGILTYKGPAEGLTGRPRAVKHPSMARYKVRQEREILVDDPEALRGLLGALGLRPVFQYEKIRSTYELPGIRGVLVELDETPIGVFLELEGEPRAIDRVSRRLGYSPKDYLVSSYGALYLADCRRRGVRPANMLFSSQKVR